MSAWQRMADDAPVASPAPRDAISIVTECFVASSRVPNHPHLPVLLLRGVFAEGVKTDEVKALFERNRWYRVWNWQVFPYQHYHPNAHEVLAVTHGWATLALGGPSGPSFDARIGDVLLLPAGTGHAMLFSRGFEVVGGYPEGQEDYEIVRADDVVPDAHMRARIAAVPLPRTDPIYGADGPLLHHWTTAAA